MIAKALFIISLLLIFWFYYFTKSKHIAVILLLFAFTSGFYFLGPELTDNIGIGPINKIEDAILIFILFDFFFKFKYNLPIIKKDKLAKLIIYFSVFVVADIFYSLLVLNIDITYVIRSSRHFLYFLAYFPLQRVKKYDKIFKFLSILVVLQIAITFFQFFTGMEVFKAVNILEGGELRRLYFTPILSEFWLFFSLILYLREKNKKYLVLYFLILIIQILTGSRGTIYSSLVLTALAVLFNRKVLSARTIVVSIVIIMLFLSLGTSYQERIKSGIEDISQIFNKEFYVNPYQYYRGNTLAFRLALTTERLSYIIKENKIVFGLGFATEDSPIADRLPFSIGLKNKYGSTIQLDTGDIVWAIFLMRLGVIGTILILINYLFILKISFQNKDNLFYSAMFFALLFDFMTSVISSYLYNNIFLILLAYVMCQKLSNFSLTKK